MKKNIYKPQPISEDDSPLIKDLLSHNRLGGAMRKSLEKSFELNPKIMIYTQGLKNKPPKQ